MKNLILAILVLSSIISFGQTQPIQLNNSTVEIGATGNILSKGTLISVNSLNSLSTDSALRINTNRPYKDILVDIATSSNTATDWTIEQYGSTGFQIPYLRHDQSNYVYGKVQYNHDKALNTKVRDVHFHAVGMASTDGNVRFVVWYKWINYGQVLPIDTTAGAGLWSRTKLTVPILGADQYKVQVIDILENITHPANETPSSILYFIAMRDGTNNLDTYTGNKGGGGTNQCNFGLFYSDSHYQISKLGSKNDVTD